MSCESVLVIPAQPGRDGTRPLLLASVCGRPVLWHAWRNANAWGGAFRVWIASDSEDVCREAQEFGAQTVLTPPCRNGSIRSCMAWRLAADPSWSFQWLVDYQGAEIVVPHEALSALTRRRPSVNPIRTLCRDPVGNEIDDPAVVKVAVSSAGRAVFFTRAPIPCGKVHVGIYAFDRRCLDTIAAAPPSALSLAESLEQMDWINAGYGIDVIQCDGPTLAVKTADDLRDAEEYLEAKHADA